MQMAEELQSPQTHCVMCGPRALARSHCHLLFCLHWLLYSIQRLVRQQGEKQLLRDTAMCIQVVLES